MKTIAAVTLALASLSGLAQAQDRQGPAPRRYGNPGYGNSGTAPWGGGVGSGYGTGTGYAYSPASGYFWGSNCHRPYYPFCGYGYGYGGSYGGSPGYGGEEWLRGSPADAASAAGAPAPAAPRSPEAASAREEEEGRRRFRSGDYRAALDAFRAAVAAHPGRPAAQAWFAVGLVTLGEGRNADKALRSAAAAGLVPGALSLDGLFRDDKERVRVIVMLAKVESEGGLAAAYALALAGEPVRLKQLAEKDPVARQLLPKP
ncbi:MAG TPA: hypothetical protein VM222_01510 [Planctomycetota bacterium]|nr:hypothetical protein [Planctomycetota bacterium]